MCGWNDNVCGWNDNVCGWNDNVCGCVVNKSFYVMCTDIITC